VPVSPSKSPAHEDLRAARERFDLTRVDLARLADCSLASLAALEAGAPIKRSAVRERAWRAIRAVEAERTGGLARAA
jgi:predicted transcriptional regulator